MLGRPGALEQRKGSLQVTVEVERALRGHGGHAPAFEQYPGQPGRRGEPRSQRFIE